MPMQAEEFLGIDVYPFDDPSKSKKTGTWQGDATLCLGLNGAQKPEIQLYNQGMISFYPDDKTSSSISIHGNGYMLFGNDRHPGQLFMRGQADKTSILLDAGEKSLTLGDLDTTSGKWIFLDGANATQITGGDGKGGQLFMRNKQGENTIHLNGETGRIKGLFDLKGRVPVTRESDGNETIVLDGNAAEISVGKPGLPGARLTGEGLILDRDPAAVPDYVFEKEYQLPALEEVAAFIARHKHLPDFPSAREIGEKGLNVGEMTLQLLKKVEELSLYAIQQAEEIASLKHRLDEDRWPEKKPHKTGR